MPHGSAARGAFCARGAAAISTKQLVGNAQGQPCRVEAMSCRIRVGELAHFPWTVLSGRVIPSGVK